MRVSLMDATVKEGGRGRPARNGTSPNDKLAHCAETVLPPLLCPTALLFEVGLLFANFIRPRRASPHGAALLMWRMAPDPPSRATGRAAADRPEHVIVERVHCAQRESCHYGRLIDRVKANENTWNPI